MTLKASHQLEYMRQTGSEAAENKKQEVQDWAVLLVFNHLLSGAEAFVAAMLWDFPVEITPQRLPSGDSGGFDSHTLPPRPRGFGTQLCSAELRSLQQPSSSPHMRPSRKSPSPRCPARHLRGAIRCGKTP